MTAAFLIFLVFYLQGGLFVAARINAAIVRLSIFDWLAVALFWPRSLFLIKVRHDV